MANLTVIQGNDRGKVYDLRGSHIVLGRDPHCEVSLSDHSVSRRHAELRVDQGKFHLIERHLRQRRADRRGGRAAGRPASPRGGHHDPGTRGDRGPPGRRRTGLHRRRRQRRGRRHPGHRPQRVRPHAGAGRIRGRGQRPPGRREPEGPLPVLLGSRGHPQHARTLRDHHGHGLRGR
ncbi:MAG: FHA domain-containing protein [Anaerolineaceae bacterium]|nr:FHA domain-containing protein [Anaerolineaceae bacterium]